MIFESNKWSVSKKIRTATVIVGGGIAGTTAAYQLRNQEFLLLELSNQLGGTSGVGSHNGIQFSQGAHYDLAYPESYGPEVLQLLEELHIIQYEPWKKSWGFAENQNLIPYHRKQRCYTHHATRKEVITGGPLKDKFVALIQSFSGKMNLPSRLISEDLRHLNNQTFSSFIASQIPMNEEMKLQLDYHMRDDYGGSSDQVSALAGIAYFACRPYYSEHVALFSPPNGNDYFLQRMIAHIDHTKLKTGHLVKSIEPTPGGYLLEVLDVNAKERLKIEAEDIIYAGQKHALKYIYPDQYTLFDNSYAPWMVVNLILKQEKDDYGFWQNEFPEASDTHFLGFIDSSVQSQTALKGYRVLTGYYCLKETDRTFLTTIGENKEKIANQTKAYAEKALQQVLKPEACYIKVMGHAMPIPKPGYLFKDANDSSNANMLYAGVDNGRLPLIFEALDSGIEAAEKLRQ